MPEDINHLNMPNQSDSSEDDLQLAAITPEADENPEHFAAIVHQALVSRLRPLKERYTDNEDEKKRTEKRNKVIALGWLPRSEAEASIILEGAKNKLNGASKTKHGNPAAALKHTYEAIVKFWQDSDRRLGILDRALTMPDDSINGPDPEDVRQLLKTDDDFRKVFEDFFFDKEALDEYNWRKDRKNRQNYAANLVMHTAQTAYPDYLRSTYAEIVRSETERSRAWADQITAAHSLPPVQIMLGDRDYTPPSLNSVRNAHNRHEVNETLESSLPLAEPEVSKEWEGFKMPPEVEAEQVDKYARQESRLRTDAEQRVSLRTAEAKELGGSEAIRNEKGELVGFNLPDDQPSAEALVRYQQEREERRRKRFSNRQ